MIRVALRGVAARPVRTLLTTLAIVLGVALVSGAFTLTDTMRGAADSLSASAYDGTDAVVSGRTAFNIEATDWTARRPTVDAKLLDKVREVPQVAVAVGDVTDEAPGARRPPRRSGSTPAAGPPARARSSSTRPRPRSSTTGSARACA
jgi:putative ABC transport system permease protein